MTATTAGEATADRRQWVVPTRRRTRRPVLISGAMGVVGAAAAALAAASCGPLRQEAGAGKPGTGGEPVPVTFISRASEEEAFTKRAAAFQEKYPRIRLDYQALPGDYQQVVFTNAAAGTLADVVYIQDRIFEYLALAGDIQPIDPLVRRDRVDLKQWYEKGVAALRFDGKLYGLPARGQVHSCFLFYNRDAFQQAGIGEPHERWTVDDLVATAERLTVRDGSRFGYGTAWGTFYLTVAALRRFGGDVLSPDGRRCVADSAQALAAVQWHWDLWHRKRIMAVKPATNNDFGDGTIAMAGQLLAGARSGIRNAVKDAFRWSMILMPKGPTGQVGAQLGVAPVTLNTRTRVVDQGWEVLKWFTDREAGVALALQSRGSNTPGMRRDVYCDERVLADPNYPREMLERTCKAMALASSVTYSVPANYRRIELEEVVGRHMHAFRENRAVPSAATMRQFTAEVQTSLDLPRTGAR